MTLVTDVAQLTSGRLTEILYDQGTLTAGAVCGVELSLVDGTNARLARLGLSYSPETEGERPASLLLKLCAAGAMFRADAEVNYYSDFAGIPESPLPRCYDSAFDLPSSQYHLLLEDLTESHRANWDVAPTAAHGRAVADAVAVLHSRTWGAAPLAGLGLRLPTAADAERFLAVVMPGAEPMVLAAAEDITDADRALLVEFAAAHSAALSARIADPAGFAFVHGDLNPGNILSPRESGGRTYLIDHQPFRWSPRSWLAVSDMACMMVLWWDTEARREFELDVLRHYQEALLSHGVADYPWEQLLADYRLSIIHCLAVPWQWCLREPERTERRWIWLPKLQRTLAALRDWQIKS